MSPLITSFLFRKKKKTKINCHITSEHAKQQAWNCTNNVSDRSRRANQQH